LADWERGNIRPSSIPSTSLSDTLRSTVFTVSFTASVGDFRATKEVEKALGTTVALRTERMVVRPRKDIVILLSRLYILRLI
jgi:hypothetical protein